MKDESYLSQSDIEFLEKEMFIQNGTLRVIRNEEGKSNQIELQAKRLQLSELRCPYCGNTRFLKFEDPSEGSKMTAERTETGEKYECALKFCYCYSCQKNWVVFTGYKDEIAVLGYKRYLELELTKAMG
jgi:transposase-like protein